MRIISKLPKKHHKTLKRCILIVIFLLTLQFLFFHIQKSKKSYQVNFREFLSTFNKTLKENDKKSWEDLRFLAYEKRRRGPGEHGGFFNLTDAEEIAKNDEWFGKEGFYVIVSDKISVDRALPEQRPLNCLTRKYLRTLPKVSVIVTFHNEILSALKRCIHSIINRSPEELLHEIILINDASTYENLGDELENYLKSDFFEGKIIFHKNLRREGLIRARMIGARLAEAEVIIFLDSHMEVTTTWLPPLLEPIVEDPTTATVPITKGMNAKTFEFDFVGPGTRGMFNWMFTYQWYAVRDYEHPELGENFQLPCMTGGSYAIRKDHFFHLGGYDEGLKIWNGENYELSLKLWLCSGRLIAVPCSGVLHLSKHHAAHRSTDDQSDFVGRNLKRVAEVWLDDYKKYFYRTDQARYDKIDAGDLTKQFELKEKLHCKPFQYYLDNVAQEMLELFPIEPKYVYGGSLQHAASKLCVGLHSLKYEEVPRLVQCSDDPQNPKKGSFLLLTSANWIKYYDYQSQCLDAAKPNFMGCHGGGGNQGWIYQPETGHIRMSYVDRCLVPKGANREIGFENCDENAQDQKWTWSLINETAIEILNKNFFLNKLK